MSLVRYNPYRFFDTGFDRLFSEFLPAVAYDAGQRNGSVISPRVEIRDEEDAIVLTAEVPGIEKDALNIEVSNGVLTLSGEKREQNERKENGNIRSEIVYGSFKRGFTLPKEVDVENITASNENGVLKLTLPKNPEAKPKQIAIEVGNGGSKEIDVS